MTKSIGFAWLVLLVMATTSCSSGANGWPEQEGQVLDEATGEPVSGVDIVVSYNGSASYTTQYCAHVSNATTDKNGMYHFPVWESGTNDLYLKDKIIQIRVYLRGYELAEDNFRDKLNIHKIRSTKRSTTDEIKAVLGAYELCDEREGVKESFIKALNQRYDELEVMVETSPEKELLNLLLHRLDIYRHGYEKAVEMLVDRDRK